MSQDKSSTGYVKGLIRQRSKKLHDSLLAQIASEYVTEDDSQNVPPLLDFLAQTSPHLTAPYWLKPIADELERALETPTRFCFSTPPQHGKSELIFHWIAWALLKGGPDREILYLTYNDDFATAQMRRAKPIAEQAGLRFRSDSRAFCEWYLDGKGKLSANGIRGSVSGKPGKLIIIDDGVKDWAEAHSRTIRDATFDALRANVITRMHPDSSLVNVMTRWHEDDLTGRMEKLGWKVINLPAINDDGEALWPEGRPIDFLEQQREQLGAHVFSALYQGRPRPIGGEVFQPPHYCNLSDIPTIGRDAIGIDLAYTAKTSADRSVSLVLRQARSGHMYVADVVTKQCEPTDFKPVLERHTSMSPGTVPVWHCSGIEKNGVASLLRRNLGININAVNAGSDKFVRAQPVAAAWNAGKILVPRDASWTARFVDEVCSFTGVGDAHDDQVDALGSAFGALSSSSEGKVKTVSRGRTKGLRSAW